MNKRLIALAVSLAFSTSALRAEDAEAPAAAKPAVEVSVAPDGPMQGTGVTGDKGKETLSVDFPNAEIRTILRNIADLFDLNLVIPETLEGRTSLKLRDVTWKQIFDVLLPPVGYTYVSDGNIIKIVSIESLNVEPAETRIFILNYSRAGEIAPTISSMVDTAKGGKIQVDTRSNALVVTERPKRLEKIDEVIKRLDKATAQVMIETKFIEIKNTDVKNIGINWASLQSYSLGTRGETKSEPGSLNSFGAPPTFDASGNQTGYGSPSTVQTPAAANGLKNSFNALFNSPQVVTSTFSADEFRVILSALQTLNETKLVSNPTVVTMNNNEAIISIGEQFPVPSYTYNQERGTFEVSGFTYKDIGIIMKVTPQVNNAGLITLKVDPEVSSRSGTTTFGGAGGADIPIIAIRRTSTQVAIKDGFTMGLGGLIESNNQNTSNKVPLLGDLPGVGGLFRHKAKDNSSRNLIVFITAKILASESSTYRDVFSPEKMEKLGVTDADAPVVAGGTH